jgi:aspartyl-tRNA(Asn)/glutamyl-tRNA(Gln) amidotransferase subunit C
MNFNIQHPGFRIPHLVSRISYLASPYRARGILTHNSTQSVIFVHMHVTDEMIEDLASLSRLRFNDEEKNEIRKDLQRMISFVEKLNEVDTTGVEPLLHMTDAMNVYREDQVSGSMPKEEALKNAPAADKNYFKVPKVIKK